MIHESMNRPSSHSPRGPWTSDPSFHGPEFSSFPVLLPRKIEELRYIFVEQRLSIEGDPKTIAYVSLDVLFLNKRDVERS